MNRASTLQRLLESAAGAALPEWSREEAAVVVQTVEPRGIVFHQDVAHPYMHAVRTGLLKLSYLRDDGTEWVKSFVPEGRFFASIAALQPGGRTSFMVSAIEPAAHERIDYRLLRELAQHHLAWSQALHALTMVFAARKESRERELLMLTAEERYIAFCNEHPALLDRIPQKDLARHLGVTPVGLNRIVMRLRRASRG